MKLKLEFWVSITAMITAIAAVVVAIVQTQVMTEEAEMEREHARLSVLPVLSISDQSSVNSESGHFSINIVNKGLGPAVIESFEMFVDEKKVESWNEFANLLSADMVHLKGNKRNINSIGTATISAGTIVANGDSISPIRLKGDADLIKSLLTNEREGRLTVCFCSLYNDCWLADSRSARPQPVDVCR